MARKEEQNGNKDCKYSRTQTNHRPHAPTRQCEARKVALGIPHLFHRRGEVGTHLFVFTLDDGWAGVREERRVVVRDKNERSGEEESGATSNRGRGSGVDERERDGDVIKQEERASQRE
jgi:hypothetical protein